MAKKLSKALRTDLNEMAALLRSKGRGRDTILAHINPEEAALLKMRGGSGKTNPETGLPEFQEEFAPFGGDTGPSWWDSFTGMFGGGGGGGGGGGENLSQYNIDVPQTDYEPVTETQPSVGQDFWQQFSGGGYDPFAYQKSLGAPTMFEQPYIKGTESLFQTPSLETLSTIEPAKLQEVNTYLDRSLGTTTDKTTTEKDTLDKIEEFAKRYPKSTNVLENILGVAGKIGLGALGSLPIQRTQRTAAQQAAQMGKEIGALGAPQKAIGTQMLAQAEAGQLTPQQQRTLAATRAQQRQALSRAGITSGTAAQQAEANAQRLANEYVSQNIDNALKMIQFGDRYVAQGIKAGYDANQQANQAANVFYQNMFGLLGGTGNLLRG